MFILIFSIIILLFSIILHEIGHGYVACKLGDPTAKYAGRLSFNPLKHLDAMGSFFFPLFTLILTGGRGPIFGWAKPVPINPYNFRDQEWGELKVAIAGPAMNLIVALVFGLSIRFFSLPSLILEMFSVICIYNLFWMLFNLLPVSPLDGSHILFALLGSRAQELKMFMQQYGFFLLFLLVFWGLDFIYPLVIKMYLLIVGVPLSTF